MELKMSDSDNNHYYLKIATMNTPDHNNPEEEVPKPKIIIVLHGHEARWSLPDLGIDKTVPLSPLAKKVSEEMALGDDTPPPPQNPLNS